MEEKFIKWYVSQKVEGYNFDFSEIYLACEVEYNDGSFGSFIETHPTLPVDVLSNNPKMAEIPHEVVSSAHDLFLATSNMPEFPEDDWHGIGDDWDLNLYVDDDGKNCATLYAVVNGNTDVETGFPIV